MTDDAYLDRAQALLDRVQTDNVQQLAANIEAGELRRAAELERVAQLPALEQQHAELRQRIGDVTNRVAAALAERDVTLPNLERQLIVLDNDIRGLRQLQSELERG